MPPYHFKKLREQWKELLKGIGLLAGTVSSVFILYSVANYSMARFVTSKHMNASSVSREDVSFGEIRDAWLTYDEHMRPKVRVEIEKNILFAGKTICECNRDGSEPVFTRRGLFGTEPYVPSKEERQKYEEMVGKLMNGVSRSNERGQKPRLRAK